MDEFATPNVQLAAGTWACTAPHDGSHHLNHSHKAVAIESLY
jgi:hypothetical protein